MFVFNKISFLLRVIRAIVGILIIVFAAIFCSLITLVLRFFVKKGSLTLVKTAYFFAVTFLQITMFLCGVKVKIEGLQNIPENEGAVYVYNHKSFWDIPVLGLLCRRVILFAAKKEISKVPILGQTLKECGMLFIDRSDRQAAIETLNNAIQNFSKGISYFIAAEGTCYEDPNQLGPFKKGPFVMAHQSQVKLVPVVIYGTHKILPRRGSLLNRYFPNIVSWRSHVSLRILPPIEPQNVAQNNLEEVDAQAIEATLNLVKDQMSKAYADLAQGQ